MAINPTDPAGTSLPFVDGIDTIEAGRTRMGIIVPDGMEACVSYLTGHGMTNRIERLVARRSPNHAKDTYIATGLYPAGAIEDRGRGRFKKNLARVPLLYADFDLKDLRGLPKQELWEMNQSDLDELLQAEAINVCRAYDDAGIPLHLLLSSGYGLQAFTQITEEDQCRISEIGGLIPRMHATLDEAFGRKVIDPGAKDPGHLMRLWGTYNNKYPPLPRPVRALASFPHKAHAGLREVERVCQPVYRGASSAGRGAYGTSEYGTASGRPIDVEAIVNLIQPEYGEGARHSISYGLSGMLLKAGVGRNRALEVIELLGENDDEPDDRLRALEDTYDRAEKEGESAVAGYSVLQQYLNPETLKKLEVLLDEHPTSRHDLPEFPVDVLPPVVQIFLNEIAKCKGVPVGLVAAPFLAATGALIGNRARISITKKARGKGWRHYPGLWVAVVGDPGTGKSPALDSALAPFHQLDDEEMQRWKKRQLEFDRACAERKDGKRGEKLRRPAPPRQYITTETTIEGFSACFLDSAGMLVHQDELAGWFNGMNQYKGKGADEQRWLTVWNGASLKIKRSDAGKSIYAPAAVASVVGGIQPEVLQTIKTGTGADNGFWDRILPVNHLNGAITLWGEAEEDEASLDAVMALVRDIDGLPLRDDPLEQQPIQIGLSPEALEVWKLWFDQNKILASKTPGRMGGMYRKLDVHVSRFALILHILKHPSEDDLREKGMMRVIVNGEASDEPPQYKPISAQTMRDAIRVGEFFRGHMPAFAEMLGKRQTELGTGGSPDSRERRNVLHAIQCKADDQGWAQRSPVLQQTGLKAEALSDITAALEVEGVLESQKSPTSGTRYRLKGPHSNEVLTRAA